jgi:anti-anti-sigma factor
MNISMSFEDKYTVFHVKERFINAENATSLRGFIFAEASRVSHNVAVDLNRVDSIDASGIGVLISLLKYVGADGKVVITSKNNAVLESFRSTNTEHLFELLVDYDS